MRKKIATILIISIFIATMVFSAVPVKGATGDWFTSYTVRDLATGEILLQKTGAGIVENYLLEGISLNITFTITVPMTVPDSTLTLKTSMQKAVTQDHWWEQKSLDYPISGFISTQQTVTFSQSQGILTMSCLGTVPLGLTTDSDAQLHKPFAFTMIKLTGPSGEFLDEIKAWIIDDKIAEYNNLLGQSQYSLSQLIDEGVDESYTELYANVISGAEAAANAGYVDTAISQLNQLATSTQPPAAVGSSIFDTLFLPVVAVLAIVAVIGVALFFKAKGKSSYVSQIVEDQIRDLEGLTLRAAKVDRSLASGLETIEDRLKRAVGA